VGDGGAADPVRPGVADPPGGARDRTAAFALTGAAACLVSPITWVHHLV